MNNSTVAMLLITLTAIVVGAFLVSNVQERDCEAAGGIVIYSHCIDRDAIIEDY